MVQIAKGLNKYVHRASLPITMGWHCHDPELLPHFLTGSWAQDWLSNTAVSSWFRLLWRKKTWKEAPSGTSMLPQMLLSGWGFCPGSSPEQHYSYMPACGHVSHWPGPWLPGLILNLSLHYELSWWSLDPWLTMVTKPNIWLWLNLRPVSLLWACLVAQTLGWSWLPSLDCLPCLGTVGLGPCWWGHCPCLPCCLLLAPSSSSLMEQCLSKGTAWQASLLKFMVIRPHSKQDRQKGPWSRWRIPQSIDNKHQEQQKEL